MIEKQKVSVKTMLPAVGFPWEVGHIASPRERRKHKQRHAREDLSTGKYNHLDRNIENNVLKKENDNVLNEDIIKL